MKSKMNLVVSLMFLGSPEFPFWHIYSHADLCYDSQSRTSLSHSQGAEEAYFMSNVYVCVCLLIQPSLTFLSDIYYLVSST